MNITYFILHTYTKPNIKSLLLYRIRYIKYLLHCQHYHNIYIYSTLLIHHLSFYKHIFNGASMCKVDVKSIYLKKCACNYITCTYSSNSSAIFINCSAKALKRVSTFLKRVGKSTCLLFLPFAPLATLSSLSHIIPFFFALLPGFFSRSSWRKPHPEALLPKWQLVQLSLNIPSPVTQKVNYPIPSAYPSHSFTSIFPLDCPKIASTFADLDKFISLSSLKNTSHTPA